MTIQIIPNVKRIKIEKDIYTRNIQKKDGLQNLTKEQRNLLNKEE
jgi:hypothetical protein